ncbi:MAG: phosphoenolpyruvate--protein phosphotransferase [Planctomycetes bacterium]|nr:phosphoenolpyruvate--protein phosphotransferase [Planctomycetota bacterium]
MAKSESQKLSILADISRIVSHSHDLQETLNNIVTVVAERMGVEVCSIYLLDEGKQKLTLRATVGLDPTSIGKVEMLVSEGLTGLVVEEGKPVAVKEAKEHPRYKFFPETHEEKVHSYLGVPLVERRNPLGVLTVQTVDSRQFNRDEIRMLETIASQVTGLITTTRTLGLLEANAKHQKALEAELSKYRREPATQAEVKKEDRKKSKVLRGHAAAPGFQMGYVHLHQHEFHIGSGFAEYAEDTGREKERLSQAFDKSIEEVSQLKSQVTNILGEEDSTIFHGHLLMLEDKGFRQRIEEVINEGRRAELAVEVVAELYKERLGKFDDVYLKERVIDVEDVERRLLRNLLGIEREEREFDEECIVVADDLSPSELIYLESPKLMGVVLAKGGVTSHVSILAKSLELPTVVGVTEVLKEVSPGDFVIVDGNSGAVYINPDETVISEYVRLQADYQTLVEELKEYRDLPAATLDGKKVRIEANIGLHSEIPLCLEQGAEGIGLYRTEFPFLSRSNFPTEEEQYTILKRAKEALHGLRLTVRTLDMGGEKTLSYFPMPQQQNPLLGWRSVRLTLDEPEIFRTQLRAIVRASGDDPVRVMFPMVSGLEELRAAKALLRSVVDELGCKPRLEIGIMIEVPAAVGTADRLAREVDFFSIGTNDLVQYILAVDRSNPKVSDRYQELHPAVLAALDQTIRAGKNAGISVSVCGEMAGSAATAILLAGMGVDCLSMSPNSIPFVKRAIRNMDTQKAGALASSLLRLDTTAEVERNLRETFRSWGILELVGLEPLEG